MFSLGLAGERYLSLSSPVTNQGDYKETADVTVISHSKPASLSSTESSDGGSSRRIENLFDLDQVASSYPIHGVGNSSLILEQSSDETEFVGEVSAKQNENVRISMDDSGDDSGGMLTEVVTDDVDSSSSHHHEREQLEEDGENDEMLGDVDSSSSHHEREKLEEDGENDEMLGEVDSSSSHHEREQLEEDGENDDEMLGGIFAFSEEG